MMNDESLALICPCCAPAVAQDPGARVTALENSGWALRFGDPREDRCGCGAPAEVRDLLDELVWCTDCWISERIERDMEAEAAERGPQGI